MNLDLFAVDPWPGAFKREIQCSLDPGRLLGGQRAGQPGFKQVQAHLCLLEGGVALLAPLGSGGVDQQVVEPFFVGFAHVQLAYQAFQVAAGQHGVFIAGAILDLGSEGEGDVPDADIGQRQFAEAVTGGAITDRRTGSAGTGPSRVCRSADGVYQGACLYGLGG